jgi:hypothetical protein
VLWAVLVPGLALASIGKVSVLEGVAKRTPREGAAQALQVGAEIELGDVLDVGPKSNLKLTLTDQSVIMLGADSRLEITEAAFKEQDREGFSAKLRFGKFWASVRKALAGSEAKFEVSTERAVAGVRGTVFRVDTVAGPKGPATATWVRVVSGKVGVEAQVRKALKGATPQPPAPKKGAREEVPGPTEVGVEEWERVFRELQAQQQVLVGEELGPTRALDRRAMADAFGRFVQRHQ